MYKNVKTEHIKVAIQKLYDLQEKREDISILLEPIIEMLDQAISKNKRTPSLNPRQAVDYAIATMRLEGFSFPSDERSDLEVLAKGKVSTEEMRNKVLAEIAYLKKKSPELFTKGDSWGKECYDF